jgi:DNA-binding transcriptional MerR regulator
MAITIGSLSRRTGVPVKTLRKYEDMGLIHTAGRSPGPYRLFDEEALWCVGVIGSLRGLGLTLAEIRELAGIYLARTEDPIGRRLAAALRAARGRVQGRITGPGAAQAGGARGRRVGRPGRRYVVTPQLLAVPALPGQRRRMARAQPGGVRRGRAGRDGPPAYPLAPRICEPSLRCATTEGLKACEYKVVFYTALYSKTI